MSSVNIYEILESKPHNKHYLKKYYNFILACSKIDHTEKTEKHHICPKAKDLFPEYKSFRQNPWNKVLLTYRQHIIAHRMLWKAYGGSQAFAFHMLMNFRDRSNIPGSLRHEISSKISLMNKGRPSKLKGKPSPLKGIKRGPFSIEHKQSISKSRKSSQQCKDASVANFRKASDLKKGKPGPNKGKSFSEDVKKNFSVAQKARNWKDAQCPHCGKIGGQTSMKRWHFDNCKSVIH